MNRSETVIFTNLCMIYDDNGNVVIQKRTDDEWAGIAFPGGYVEKEEPFTDSVIREIWEETGLKIWDVELCGVQDWTENGVRNVIFLYKTNKFKGELVSSAEGEVEWVPMSKLNELPLAVGMTGMIEVLNNRNLSEHFYYKENGEWVEVHK